jgi:AcrR family transcriptional regulator
VPAASGEGLTNQRRRTRKDLLEAAARLLREGATNPAMEEVAEAALVSRATAYRYFPSVEALLTEASIDTEVPDPREVFAGDSSTDPVDRADRAEAALHEMTFGNETQLRLMLVHSIQQALKAGDAMPVRQNRRIPLIEAALAPARNRFTGASYQKLCAALALLFGPEAMVVFRDVLQTDAAEARQVKSWAVRALVQAALAESEDA